MTSRGGKKTKSKDPDIAGALPALRRAARAARRLAESTGTPLYVFEGGKVVNINPVRRKRAAAMLRRRK